MIPYLRRLALILVAASACAEPQLAKLERGMSHAWRELHRVNTDPLAAEWMRGLLEMGGGYADHIYASMPENADLPAFYDGAPEQSWSIAFTSLGDGRVVIEGFGESKAEPTLADTILIDPMPRP